MYANILKYFLGNIFNGNERATLVYYKVFNVWWLGCELALEYVPGTTSAKLVFYYNVYRF